MDVTECRIDMVGIGWCVELRRVLGQRVFFGVFVPSFTVWILFFVVFGYVSR